MEITFAKVNAKGIVTSVIVADQTHIDSLPDADSWVQTWQDADGEPAKAYNYAGIGFKYLPSDNAFITQQPYQSWILNSKFQWQPPIPVPSDGGKYSWDEPTKSWIKVP